MAYISIFSPSNNPVPLLKAHFAGATIKSAHRILDYTNSIDFLISVGTSDLYIVNNSSPLDDAAASSLIQALLHQVPILLANPPIFTSDVPYLVRALINKRLNKLYIGDITQLDASDRATLLHEICKPINYVLSAHERELARACLRAFFRSRI